MNAVELFLLDHARVHAAEVTGNAGGVSLPDIATRGLTDEQWRLRPHGLNSLAWILWHVARYEDVALNVLIAGRRQVFGAEGWADRLGVTRRDIGTEMTAVEVEALSRTIVIPALRAYRRAVALRTREIAAGLPAAALDPPVPAARLAEVRAQGAFLPAAEWVPRIWDGKTVAWFLAWIGAGHPYMHLGQARWVRKLILAGVTA